MRAGVLRLCWGFVCLGFVVTAASVGCKKPTVEEDKGVLPLPQAPTREAVAAQSVEEGAKPKPAEKTPISVEQACALVDDHLRSYGVDVSNRECTRLLPQESGLRVDGYSFRESGPGSTSREVTLNACLWQVGAGDVWRVGYLDRMNRDCRIAAQFCKLGAYRTISDWSHSACPSDTVHKPSATTEVLRSLAGTWKRDSSEEASGRELQIAPDGTVRWSLSADTESTGSIQVASASGLELDVESMRRRISYAVIDDALFWSRGLIIPEGPDDSFLIPLSKTKQLRRYNGACYLIGEIPSDYPMHVPCKSQVGEDGNSYWEIKFSDTRIVNLYKNGKYWMDSESLASRYRRVGQVNKP